MLKEYFDLEKYEELKKSKDLIYKALEIVSTLFEYDKDKGGMPYILHIIYVYRHVNTKEEKVVGLLHDVLEDTDMTAKDLSCLGYDENFIKTLENLTNTSETYEKYIDKLILTNDKEAFEIKMKDLLNNLDLTRLKKVTTRDIVRSKKYVKAYVKIIEKMEGEEIW